MEFAYYHMSSVALQKDSLVNPYVDFQRRDFRKPLEMADLRLLPSKLDVLDALAIKKKLGTIEIML